MCYRSGLKTTLNVRQNLNNEIVYIESGKWPLCPRIKKAQLKFWLYVGEYTSFYPDSALAKVIDSGLTHNVSYLKHYTQLQDTYTDANTCQTSIEKYLHNTYKSVLEKALFDDQDSRLGTYFRVNPLLQSHVPNPQNILEIERELVTWFRTGSHSLAIERGRYSNTAREDRVCRCGNGPQSVWHIFMECPLTQALVDRRSYQDLSEIFADDDVHQKLLLICNTLRIDI